MKRNFGAFSAMLLILALIVPSRSEQRPPEKQKTVKIFLDSGDIPEEIQRWIDQGDYQVEIRKRGKRRQLAELRDRLVIFTDEQDAKWDWTLKKQVTLDFPIDTPLREILEDLHKQTGANIQIDTNALRDIGIDPSIETHIVFKKISMGNAMRHLLYQHYLTYVIKNEVILVTTPDKSQECLATRLYHLDDILIKQVDEDGVPCYNRNDFVPLMRIISDTVEPKTWQEVGGAGTIDAYMTPRGPLLVVSQTSDVHEKTLHLLATLASYGMPREGEARPVIQVPREEQLHQQQLDRLEDKEQDEMFLQSRGF